MARVAWPALRGFSAWWPWVALRPAPGLGRTHPSSRLPVTNFWPTSRFLPTTSWRAGIRGRKGVAKPPVTSRKLSRRPGWSRAGDFGSYYQNFRVTSGREVRPESSLTINGTVARLDQDFAVAPGVGQSNGDGPLVFAGYGIHAPEVGHDDYAALDVEGKVVIVLAGAPGRANDEGEFLDTKAAGAKAVARAKFETAFARKAQGLILIQTSSENGDDADVLPVYSSERGEGLSFAAVHVTETFGDQLLATIGTSVAEIEQRIGAGETLHGPLEERTASIEVLCEPIVRPTANVIGVLATGNDDAETIVIGAHYDHLGLGDASSLGGAGEIHNGADDNASGTAALIEIAQACRQHPHWNRNVVFVAFSAEELGLHGSNYYTKNPTRSLESTIAMLNLDMIGRSKDGFCAVGPVSCAKELSPSPPASTKTSR